MCFDDGVVGRTDSVLTPEHRVEVKAHGPDSLGPQEWFVSVRTPDDTWTFLSAHDEEPAARLAAEIVTDAIRDALRPLADEAKTWQRRALACSVAINAIDNADSALMDAGIADALDKANVPGLWDAYNTYDHCLQDAVTLADYARSPLALPAGTEAASADATNETSALRAEVAALRVVAEAAKDVADNFGHDHDHDMCRDDCTWKALHDALRPLDRSGPPATHSTSDAVAEDR